MLAGSAVRGDQHDLRRREGRLAAATTLSPKGSKRRQRRWLSPLFVPTADAYGGGGGAVDRARRGVHAQPLPPAAVVRVPRRAGRRPRPCPPPGEPPPEGPLPAAASPAATS
ncbi:hypothetical protein OsJ_21065 [Oryza sativa Japonica Group]|uniref:Uncharacterized protein n=1 Tax=Oryza sativa subsp. japonica TaxID=39947 RepID=B9FSV7_ORYSJ|nr:hypothetical protein OsJ_21065 [Oryza sativa Japonica Group]